MVVSSVGQGLCAAKNLERCGEAGLSRQEYSLGEITKTKRKRYALAWHLASLDFSLAEYLDSGRLPKALPSAGDSILFDIGRQNFYMSVCGHIFCKIQSIKQ